MSVHLPDPPVPADAPRSAQWRRIGVRAWRRLKRKIVAAAQAGGISKERASELIRRFHLKDL